MPDPIAPPVARRAEETVELVSQAFSDGDIEAALALYESTAQLLPWAHPADGAYGGLRHELAHLMDLRLPLNVEVGDLLQISGLTVVMCERRIAGTGPDCEPVRLRGFGFAAVREQPDGTWRIAVDAWCLEPQPVEPDDQANPLEPPELPPVRGSDASHGEGPERAASPT